MSHGTLNITGLNLETLQKRGLGVGLAASAICGIAAVANPSQFFHSYLLAFLFWAGIPLGCLGIAMLHYLTGGDWSRSVYGLLDSAARTLPLVGLLFLPLLFGSRWIYYWAQGNELPSQQEQYFDLWFVVLRAILYFVVWIALARLLGRWSQEDARDSSTRSGRRLRVLSGPGLLAWGLAATFAAVDWLMSLEPGWYSTIIGLMFITGQLMSALAFVIVAVTLWKAPSAEESAGRAELLHDLGKLLLTFVMLWAYMAFSQFLIIWSENLPEEIPYYVHRFSGGWLWVGVVLLLFHFAVPFFLLLSKQLKQNARALGILAALIAIMHAVDLFWQTGPALSPQSLRIHWMDFLLPAGVGGLWLSYFARQLQHDADSIRQVRAGVEIAK
jgi:hypothetical protein